MKPFMIFFLAVIISACGSSEKTLYVNATSLNLRETPSSSAKVINLIPFGSRLKVVKTSHIYKESGKEYAWYKLANAKAYLAGKYLVKKMPKRNEMQLVTSIGFFAYGKTVLVKLKNGRVIWCVIDNGSAYHKSSYYRIIRFTGEYKITRKSISIVFNRKGQLQYFNSSSKPIQDYHRKKLRTGDFNEKKHIAPEKELLKWEAILGGFLHSKTIKFFKNKNWQRNFKRSSFTKSMAGNIPPPDGYGMTNDEKGRALFEVGYLSTRKTHGRKFSREALRFINFGSVSSK